MPLSRVKASISQDPRTADSGSPKGVVERHRAGIRSLLGANRSAELLDCINRIKANGLCKIQKLNNVNSPLAAFDRGHKRLITP
jgi:hypothetical protein